MGAGASHNVAAEAEAQGAGQGKSADKAASHTNAPVPDKTDAKATTPPTANTTSDKSAVPCPLFTNYMPDEAVVPSLLLPRRTHSGTLMRPKAPPPGATLIALRRLQPSASSSPSSSSSQTPATKANTASATKSANSNGGSCRNVCDAATSLFAKGAGQSHHAQAETAMCVFVCNVASSALAGGGATLSSVVADPTTTIAATTTTTAAVSSALRPPSSLLQMSLAGPPPQNMTTVNSVTVPHTFAFKSQTDRAIGACLLISYVVNDSGRVAGLNPKMLEGKPRKGFNVTFPSAPIVRVADNNNNDDDTTTTTANHADNTPPPASPSAPAKATGDGNPLRASGYDYDTAGTAHAFYDGYDSGDGMASNSSSENGHHNGHHFMLDLYSGNSSTSTYSESGYSSGPEMMKRLNEERLDEAGDSACLVTVLDKPKVVDKEVVPGLKPEMVMQSLLVRISSFKERPGAATDSKAATTPPPLLRRSRSLRRSLRPAIATLKTRWCLFNDSRTHEAHVSFTFCYEAAGGQEGGEEGAVRVLCRPTPHLGPASEGKEGHTRTSGTATPSNGSFANNNCYVELQESKLGSIDEFWAQVPAECSYHSPHAAASKDGRASHEDEAAVQARLRRQVRANAQTRVLLALAPGAAVMVAEGALAAYYLHVTAVPFRKSQSLAVMGACYSPEDVRAARQHVAELGSKAQRKKTLGSFLGSKGGGGGAFGGSEKNKCYVYELLYVNALHEDESAKTGTSPTAATTAQPNAASAIVSSSSSSPPSASAPANHTTTSPSPPSQPPPPSSSSAHETATTKTADVFASSQGLRDFGPLVRVVDDEGHAVRSPGTTPPTLFQHPPTRSALKRLTPSSPHPLPEKEKGEKERAKEKPQKELKDKAQTTLGHKDKAPQPHTTTNNNSSTSGKEEKAQDALVVVVKAKPTRQSGATAAPRRSVPPMLQAVRLKRKPITAHLSHTILPPLKDKPSENVRSARGQQATTTTTTTTTMMMTTTSSTIMTSSSSLSGGGGTGITKIAAAEREGEEDGVKPMQAAESQRCLSARVVNETSASTVSPSASCATLPKLPSALGHGKKRNSLAVGTNGRGGKGMENESDRDLSSSMLSMQF